MGSPQLRKREIKALDEFAERELPCIAAISLWEAQMLVSRNRLIPNEPFDQWIHKVSSPEVVHILPLDSEVITALHKLPESFHADPADRLIVATARAHELPLATSDARIRRSRLVRIWPPKII